MRTTCVLPALLALAVPILFLLSGTADAYLAEGHPWPGGVIRYYNGQRPTSKVRVAHLFSSSRFALFAADRWMP